MLANYANSETQRNVTKCWQHLFTCLNAAKRAGAECSHTMVGNCTVPEDKTFSFMHWMPKPSWHLSSMQGNNLRPVGCKTGVSSGRPICSANVWRLTAANSSHVYQCSLLDMSDWTELLESTDGEWKQRNKHCLTHMHVTSYSTRIRTRQ